MSGENSVNGYGGLFYKEEYFPDTLLLKFSLREIMDYLHPNYLLKDSISFSELCLTSGIAYNTGKLIHADVVSLIEKSFIEKKAPLKPRLGIINQLKDIMVKHYPPCKDFSNSNVKDYVTVMIKSWSPELLPYVENIEVGNKKKRNVRNISKYS